MNTYPKIALLRSTSKPFEKRIPIHPKHFNLISPLIRKHLVIEKGYLQNFGYSDSFCHEYRMSAEDRNSLIASADCCLLVRPMPTDLSSMKEHAVALGWMHCVQNQDMAQAGINNSLTLICMEGLFDDEGNYLFKENSKITGQQAIKHALKITDHVDTSQKVAVIGHGTAGKAAIHELLDLGFKDITCLSRRSESEIKDAVKGVNFVQIKGDISSTHVFTMDGIPILKLLQKFQIIVNATTQNIYEPSIFIHTSEISQLYKGTLIIDISCDRKMGFEFSEVTYLDSPIIKYDFMSYCAIDHLPTLDYDNASQAISQSLLKILPPLFNYLKDGKLSTTLERAIQIQEGKVINQDILYFREHFLNSTGSHNFKEIK